MDDDYSLADLIAEQATIRASTLSAKAETSACRLVTDRPIP